MRLIPYFVGGKDSPVVVGEIMTWDAWEFQGRTDYTDGQGNITYGWVRDEDTAVGQDNYRLEFTHPDITPYRPIDDVCYVDVLPSVEDLTTWPVKIVENNPLIRLKDNAFHIKLDWQYFRWDDGSQPAEVTLFTLRDANGTTRMVFEFLRGSSHDIYTVRMFNAAGDELVSNGISIPEVIDPYIKTSLDFYYASDRTMRMVVNGVIAELDYFDTGPTDDGGWASLTMFEAPRLTVQDQPHIQIHYMQINRDLAPPIT